MIKTSRLCLGLAKPMQLGRFSEADWDITLRQARAAGLLATLYYAALDANQFDQLPERVRAQLAAARHVADRHQEVMQWEVEAIHHVLDRIGVPMIVLKGAAYVVAGLEAARGRLFGDIDILVPHGALTDVERVLGRAGWVQEDRSTYNDRYYRQWMHEIPARRHAQRGTVLDVHHNILPLTARNKPRAQALWDAALPMSGFNDLYVLAREDMLLHSAAHLFLNGEFERGLRDLNDFRRLGQQFANTAQFWHSLKKRAETLDLVQPLAYAVRYANRLLDAGIPEAGMPELSRPGTWLMDPLLTRGLQPNHASAHDLWTPAALFGLYVRGHYLRMPLHLLLPHLLYKGTLAKFDEQALHDANQEKLAQFRAFLGK
jgi:hypothetical protein